ncbi:hypothetical protein SEA_VERITY_78 [Gordonia phage Verity]|uniref:Uncharacterized protein n=1 Tax=Gordonia phage Verity TaxID=2591211 RepID=A0A514DIZ5_9CAUD|nr:hypothetical protein J1776_gp78 [Gordonia phage Verity]QDH93564.1 hypothetical protein SEA_VERITY_78 [Gordonia phage Verity]QPO16922.1 hypothetical protein SEA_DELREY21_79 [Gordonia phage Delrey21]QXN74205.1 hypothetical protein SEA_DOCTORFROGGO_79 [Gordonia phage DoctorFroggo]
MNLPAIMRMRQIRNNAETIRQESIGRVSDIAELISELTDLLLTELADDEPVPPAGVHLDPADRKSGVNVAVGQVIEHSRLLEACAPDVVVRNGPAEARSYFRRTRQKSGGVPRKWQPCDENGLIRRHASWHDGFDSDQLFLPATVVKLPTQVIR